MSNGACGTNFLVSELAEALRWKGIYDGAPIRTLTPELVAAWDAYIEERGGILSPFISSGIRSVPFELRCVTLDNADLGDELIEDFRVVTAIALAEAEEQAEQVIRIEPPLEIVGVVPEPEPEESGLPEARTGTRTSIGRILIGIGLALGGLFGLAVMITPQVRRKRKKRA